MVIATKAYYPMYDGTKEKGLSRKSLFREVNASLKRLRTDYIDECGIIGPNRKSLINQGFAA